MPTSVGSRVPKLSADAYVRGVRDPQTLGVPAHGGAWTALVFYPRDFTFVCPTELQGFAELQDAFAAEDATLMAASTDSFYSHKAWFESHSLLADVRYPVLADPSHELSRAFGVLGDDGAALRGTFLIDPAGILRHASVTDLNVGRSPAETLRVLQALRTGELCSVDWRPGVATLSVAA
jgi:peroxiredoxin (alkyl hydroperoxide reductase subunit C)